MISKTIQMLGQLLAVAKSNFKLFSAPVEEEEEKEEQKPKREVSPI